MGAQSDLNPGEVDAVLGRIAELTEGAIRQLDQADIQARTIYCLKTGDHGVSVSVNGSRLIAWWGGKPLIDIDRASLAAIVPDDPGDVA